MIHREISCYRSVIVLNVFSKTLPVDPIWKRFFEGQAKECSSVLPSHAFQDHSYHPRKSKNINRSFLYLLLKKESLLAIFIYSIILDLNYLLAPCTSSMKINEVGRAWFFIAMRDHYAIIIKNFISSLLLKNIQYYPL